MLSLLPYFFNVEAAESKREMVEKDPTSLWLWRRRRERQDKERDGRESVRESEKEREKRERDEKERRGRREEERRNGRAWKPQMAAQRAQPMIAPHTLFKIGAYEL